MILKYLKKSAQRFLFTKDLFHKNNLYFSESILPNKWDYERSKC